MKVINIYSYFEKVPIYYEIGSPNGGHCRYFPIEQYGITSIHRHLYNNYLHREFIKWLELQL